MYVLSASRLLLVLLMNTNHTHLDSALFLSKVAVWAAALICTLSLPMALANDWLILICAPLAGLILAHGVELQHQSLHYTGVKSHRVSRALGFVLGLPALTPFSAYQLTHLWHHKNIGTANDREFFSHRLMGFSLVEFLAFAFSPLRALHGAFDKFQFPNNTRVQRTSKMGQRILLEFTAMKLFLSSGIMLCFIAPHFYSVLATWVFAYWSFSIWHFLIEFPEHYRCENLSGDVLKNTRSITSVPLARYLTNSNNFHVEHHLNPQVPMQKLCVVHTQIRSSIRYKCTGYVEFYKAVYREVK